MLRLSLTKQRLQIHLTIIFHLLLKNILNKRKYHGNKSYMDYLVNPIGNSFVLFPCDETEVKAQILQLKENKSVGPNSVPTNILHLIVDIVSLPLSQIFNLSFTTGICTLKNLKLQKLYQFLKKGPSLRHRITDLYLSFLI